MLCGANTPWYRVKCILGGGTSLLPGLPERLARFAHARLDSLSGGQFQLLCVWACLASPAGLVLLDEPTNNLDPAGVNLLGELLANRRQGQAIVLISHEPRFMTALAPRVVDLNPLHKPEF